ncbi:MAG: hypothetical protein ACTSQG_09705 [Promethearchaeota archaeon]
MKTLSKKFIYCECNKGNNRHPIRVVKVDDDLKQFIKEILEEIYNLYENYNSDNEEFNFTIGHLIQDIRNKIKQKAGDKIK